MSAKAAIADETAIAPIPMEDKAITRHEWVYRQLREAMLTGQFVPGRSVTLRGIGTALGVSLTPVREALRRLVSERALEVHGNRRVSVPRMTPEKLADICSVRVALETLAAEQSLPAIDAERVARLRWINQKTDEAIAVKDVRAYLSRNREFHYTIYDVGQGAVAMPLIESLWLQFSPFLRFAIDHIGVDYYLVDWHEKTLQAVERRDVRALRFALEADIRDGLGSLFTESDWADLEAGRGGRKGVSPA